MPEHEYFINQELIEEMVRLKRQAKAVTEAMGGVLAEQADLSDIHDILDLACGPGEWAMQVAHDYPDKHVVGIDKSRRMIEYATVQAEAGGISNVTFQITDITQPLQIFSSESFDLINIRFIMAFMRKEAWPLLLAECLRLLRPGGLLRVTEQESGFSNDPVYQSYIDLWGTAWRKAGHAYSHTQAYIGVTVVLKLLMQEAGFTNALHRPISIDLSEGQPWHQAMLENFSEALILASPFLTDHLSVITQKNLDIMAKEFKSLIGKKGFCAYWLLQTIWAQKAPLRL